MKKANAVVEAKRNGNKGITEPCYATTNLCKCYDVKAHVSPVEEMKRDNFGIRIVVDQIPVTHVLNEDENDDTPKEEGAAASCARTRAVWNGR
jgi:hypothetical protein